MIYTIKLNPSESITFEDTPDDRIKVTFKTGLLPITRYVSMETASAMGFGLECVQQTIETRQDQRQQAA